MKNHEEFLEAIAATIGKPEDKPGEWELAFPHGGKLWVKLYPDTGSPWIAVQFREWPAEDLPDGVNPFSGKWNTHITMPGGPKTAEDLSRIYEDTVRDFTRKLARVGWTPPAERQAGLPDDGSWQVSVDDGKYTVCFDGKGKLTALRYGEPWQDLVGNNLVYWLAVELREARGQKGPASGLTAGELKTIRAALGVASNITGAARDFRDECLRLAKQLER